MKEPITNATTISFQTSTPTQSPTSTLTTRFARNTRVLRTDTPLSEDQMRTVAPSVFAQAKHSSRSDRYTYIPTIDVLRGLQREGFQPFMVAQGASRIEGKAEFTKHMLRLRHVSAEDNQITRSEANEVILINSHDGASSYQLLCGLVRFACSNGLVVGSITSDIRVAHKGNAIGEVIEGATRVLKDFEAVDASTESMKTLTLNPEEEAAFASAALALRYGQRGKDEPPLPITADQLLAARRPEDLGRSLWMVLNRIQENLQRGGLIGRSALGRRIHTRAIGSIDRTVTLNRALWVLAEEMRKLKA